MGVVWTGAPLKGSADWPDSQASRERDVAARRAANLASQASTIPKLGTAPTLTKV